MPKRLQGRTGISPAKDLWLGWSLWVKQCCWKPGKPCHNELVPKPGLVLMFWSVCLNMASQNGWCVPTLLYHRTLAQQLIDKCKTPNLDLKSAPFRFVCDISSLNWDWCEKLHLQWRTHFYFWSVSHRQPERLPLGWKQVTFHPKAIEMTATNSIKSL